MAEQVAGLNTVDRILVGLQHLPSRTEVRCMSAYSPYVPDSTRSELHPSEGWMRRYNCWPYRKAGSICRYRTCNQSQKRCPPWESKKSSGVSRDATSLREQPSVVQDLRLPIRF